MSAPTEAPGLVPNWDRRPGEWSDIRPHGTEAGAMRHRRHGEKPCDACLRAENAAHAYRRVTAPASERDQPARPRRGATAALRAGQKTRTGDSAMTIATTPAHAPLPTAAFDPAAAAVFGRARAEMAARQMAAPEATAGLEEPEAGR